MKIDIHVHTKKIKSGDSETRNVGAKKFGEIIKNTDVKILAITNHNHFDLSQYNEFREEVSTSCQIWPGIELDILENEKRAHLLIIANPNNHILFSEAVNDLFVDKNLDTVALTLSETVTVFDKLDCIYIAHYFVKKPNLEDHEMDLLSKLVSNPKRILKESTNSISAGIYISHGHNSIYGSDIQNWDDYITISKQLPELRLPVESFEQFCLLLEKDEATIDTLLNKKVKETIELAPFGVAELIRLDIYSDINILFGSKGTGKTIILEALSKYFNSKGHKTGVYKSNDQHLNDVFDLKGNNFYINANELEIDDCESEFGFIKNVTEEEVNSLAKYLLHFSSQETNKISQKLKIKNITKIDETQPQRRLDDVNTVSSKFSDFIDYLEKEEKLNELIDIDMINELIIILNKVLSKLKLETENKFFESHSISLLNGIIELFQTEISRKTGLPQKPRETGFAKYSSNRIKIEVAIRKILFNINIGINPIRDYVGSLGLKGELFCRTNLVIQNGSISDKNFSPIQKKVNKTPPKEFVKGIITISKYIHSNDLFEKISDLNEINGIETIQNLNDLLMFYRHFTINEELYEPSNGESSMLLLHMELLEVKDIYLIDEPEKSLGNDYISNVIVPLLKEKALMGKKVIIATHDANIAVRTLPYNSIYRLHDTNQYFTFTGNPFSNKLKCINSRRSELDWKEISMKTLEGGKDAFGERGKIYGN